VLSLLELPLTLKLVQRSRRSLLGLLDTSESLRRGAGLTMALAYSIGYSIGVATLTRHLRMQQEYLHVRHDRELKVCRMSDRDSFVETLEISTAAAVYNTYRYR
jgi:hypothetical protein